MGLLPPRRIQVRGTLLWMPHFNRDFNSKTHTCKPRTLMGLFMPSLQGCGMLGTQPSLPYQREATESVGPPLMSRNSYDCSQGNRLSESDDLTSVRGSSQSCCWSIPTQVKQSRMDWKQGPSLHQESINRNHTCTWRGTTGTQLSARKPAGFNKAIHWILKTVNSDVGNK